MEYDFNGTKINLKDTFCQLWDNEIISTDPSANLYIRLTNQCNARCRFCVYHGEKTELNLEALELALFELKNRNIIYKMQITGGEPTVEPELLQDVVKIIRKYFKSNFVGINSNGFRLGALEDIDKYVDNFAISRHHYDDTINQNIFGTTHIPNTSDLESFIKCVGSEKVHFSCNLMKQYIGNMGEIQRYLEFASATGCNDVGFVSLMPVNKFAASQQVIFDESGIDESSDFMKYKQYTKCGGCCKCANYMYFCKNTGRMIDIYGRFAAQKDNTPGILSFDKDTLREGFNGLKIPLSYH